jgi:hypothetical protein
MDDHALLSRRDAAVIWPHRNCTGWRYQPTHTEKTTIRAYQKQDLYFLRILYCKLLLKAVGGAAKDSDSRAEHDDNDDDDEHSDGDGHDTDENNDDSGDDAGNSDDSDSDDDNEKM